MVAAYLWFNGIAYLLLGLWCAFAVQKSASTVGFTALSSSGACEFSAVYGGLQFALGLVFGYTALRAEWRAAGILFAVFLYGGIVVFRGIGLVRFWPVETTTLGFAGFEALMLVLAIAIYMGQRPAAS